MGVLAGATQLSEALPAAEFTPPLPPLSAPRCAT